MPSPCEFTKKADDKVEIKDSEGMIVPHDPTSQEFWDIISEESRKNGTFKHKNHYFFSDLDRLIDHFKKWQSLIYVTVRHHPSQRKVSDHDKDTILSEHQMIRLSKAVARLDDVASTPGSLDDDGKSGLVSTLSDTWITPELLTQINIDIQDCTTKIRKVSSWPITRTFVYLDISDFSKMRPGTQNLTINAIVRMIEHTPYWTDGKVNALLEDMDAKICIGDGYIFVFKNALKATRFAAYLAQLAEHLVAHRLIPVVFHFRMGVHVGEVLCLHDPGRKDWNFIGNGINGGQRVLGAIGKETDDVLFISAEVRQSITPEAPSADRESIMSNLHNRGRRADKHGFMWRVYEVSHTALYSEVTDKLTP